MWALGALISAWWMYIIIIITQDRLTVLRENKAGLQNRTLFQILSSEYYSVRVHVCVCVHARMCSKRKEFITALMLMIFKTVLMQVHAGDCF